MIDEVEIENRDQAPERRRRRKWTLERNSLKFRVGLA